MQRAIARFAAAGTFRPVGAAELETSDVRLLASAPVDLANQVAEGRFRSDLFYALSKTTIVTPALRARKDDLAILAQNFLFDAAAKHGKPIHGLSDDALRFLERYDWPGNMRELEIEMVRRLIFSQDSSLGPELISRHILQANPDEKTRDNGVDQVLVSNGTLKERVEQIEMRILRETLTRLKWNKSRAAAELGLSRVGLRAKIERYGIAEPGRAEHREPQED
jgi:two-component system response regulator HupR/HoxA